MELVTKSILSRVCLILAIGLMLVTITGIVAGAPSGLVLWNKLGSNDEVINSAYGPDLEFYAGGGSPPDGIANRKYVPGKFGNGVTIDTGDYYSMQRIRNIVLKDLPNYMDPEQGTIEVWYNQKELPVEYDHNPYRIFDGGFGLDSGMGFYVFLTDLAFALQFDGTPRVITYNANNLPNNQWIHLAAVWDRNGIDGTSETMRIYIDGNKVASGTDNDWGTSVGYWADICGGNDQNIADKFAMDNLKIWNYAKTDFSDRFVEGFEVPATIDIDPNTLNLMSNGEWITTYLELPEGYDVNNIVVSTIALKTPSGDVTVDSNAPAIVGDYDSDGVSDLMVKFDRSKVVDLLSLTDVVNDGTGIVQQLELTVVGELADGTSFKDTDTIRVIKKGK